MITSPYFQLSVLNLCETLDNDEDVLTCKVTSINNKQVQASFPFNEHVEISTPEHPEESIFSVPTWYISTNENFKDTFYKVEISSSKSKEFPPYKLILNASDLLKTTHYNKHTEICKNGLYTLYGAIKANDNGLVYTITAKVSQVQQLEAV